MGPPRPCSHVLARPGLLRPFLLLHLGRHHTHCHLCLSQALAQVSRAVSHGAAHLWGCRGDPTGDAPQLSLMGYRRLRLSVLDQEASLQMVDQTQLSYVVCT